MLDSLDSRILAEIADGLPLAPAPYAVVGSRLGVGESEVIARIEGMIARGIIRRFGAVVPHRELGFTANAKTVWNVPDDEADKIGGIVAAYPFVTLCYRRPRRLPAWPYNLFCMIHGRDRITVLDQVDILNREAGLGRFPHAVLFSRLRFKQRGARYVHRPAMEAAE
ncbi:MAG: AsnC family protein [Rhodospirillales bacterium]|nr:AsnC family protein [Rhodospirillales bacterium]